MSEKQSLYRKQIVKELYFSSSLSCAELSSRIDKSIPLTTKILNELMAEGIVVETGLAPSTGGRRPVMFSLKQDVLYTVSVALDQFVARIALMDMHNQFLMPVQKFDLPLYNNTAAADTLTTKINEVIQQSGLSHEQVVGIGIGMPGFVDAKKGINYSFLDVKGKSLSDYIEEKTGFPAFIDNDSSLIALAELQFGAAKGRKNAMVINIGWGVGLGMILNGELFRGHNGFAGEFSHIPLFLNGKLCSCGKTGCLETETSLLVVIEKAKEGLQSGRPSMLKSEYLEQFEKASESLTQAVHQGDRFAVELFSETAYKIGRGVAVLIHLLNPELIILSGRGSAAGRIWQAPIQHAINEHSIPRLAANTSIEVSELGYNAELIGAAALVMENASKEKTGKLIKVKTNKSQLQTS